MSLDELKDKLKHMPGKHPQSRHGKGGSGGGSGGRGGGLAEVTGSESAFRQGKVHKIPKGWKKEQFGSSESLARTVNTKRGGEFNLRMLPGATREGSAIVTLSVDNTTPSGKFRQRNISSFTSQFATEFADDLAAGKASWADLKKGRYSI